MAYRTVENKNRTIARDIEHIEERLQSLRDALSEMDYDRIRMLANYIEGDARHIAFVTLD
jgi:hypothetical protein